MENAEDVTSRLLNTSGVVHGNFEQNTEKLHSVTIKEYHYFTGHTGSQGIPGKTGGIRYNIDISPNGNYKSDHVSYDNPNFSLTRGLTYYFNIQTPGHPFWICTDRTNTPINGYSRAINNGTDNSTIEFTVPFDAPDMLYYTCANHGHMSGIISICDFGPTGPTGPSGGPTGDSGPTGPTGDLGGPTGPTGVTGPTGPTSESSICTYINCYSTSSQVIPTGYPVVFENNNLVYGCCDHSMNTPGIFVWKAGNYSVFTNIYHIETCQFSLYKNRSEIIPGTTVGSISGSTQNSIVSFITISDADIRFQTDLSPTGNACLIELVNTTSIIPYVTLYDSSGLGFSIPQINASICLSML